MWSFDYSKCRRGELTLSIRVPWTAEMDAE